MGLTAAGIVGITTALGSAGASFTQAGKQTDLTKKADAAAKRAIAKAKAELDVNFYEKIGIQREAYEREREALLSAGAQAIQAGQEGERTGEATAGRVQMAQQEGQRQIAGAMGQELMQLEGLTAQEDARLTTAKASLDLAQAEGAMAASAQAAGQQAASISNAFSSIGSAGQQYLQGSELYKQTEGTRGLEKLNKEYQKASKAGTLGSRFKDAQGNPLPFNQAISRMEGFEKDLSKTLSMTDLEAKSYLADRPDLMRELNNLGFGSNNQYAPPIAQQGVRLGASNMVPNNLSNFQFAPGLTSQFNKGF
jgi:hypothetical protein